MIKASLDESISHALKLKYEAQAAEARTNIDIYMENPAGIGEPVSYTHLRAHET